MVLIHLGNSEQTHPLFSEKIGLTQLAFFYLPKTAETAEIRRCKNIHAS